MITYICLMKQVIKADIFSLKRVSTKCIAMFWFSNWPFSYIMYAMYRNIVASLYFCTACCTCCFPVWAFHILFLCLEPAADLVLHTEICKVLHKRASWLSNTFIDGVVAQRKYFYNKVFHRVLHCSAGYILSREKSTEMRTCCCTALFHSTQVFRTCSIPALGFT